jgi:two-component system phosphate regulon sensor histidine kinase PhoR
VIFGTIAVIGLVATQIYWVKNAFDIKEKQFDHNVQMALMKVLNQVLFFKGDTTRVMEPIRQLNDDFYVVTVPEKIYPNLLEYLLKKQFELHHLDMDFEYGIYDCNTNNILYGSYVNFDEIKEAFLQSNKTNAQSHTVFPNLNKDEYYFIVHFPTKKNYMIGQMGFWGASSILLMFVVIFFAYAVFVILKQKRLSEIQTDFINNMTHEFKTPLSTIAISTDALLQPNIINNPERLTTYATIIQDEANRLKNQVERVLQMAKLEKQQIKLNKELFDMHYLIRQSVDNMKLTIYNKNGQVQLKLNANPSELLIDKLHLTNIIYNLIDNALKYNDKETPEITIETRNVKKGMEIEVSDNGIGIPADLQQHVFDKFYRVQTGNVHDVKGFGLGLNYVKIIVETHKGTVRLTSELQQGTKFIIFLPNK